jgi:hypothetical protein
MYASRNVPAAGENAGSTRDASVANVSAAGEADAFLERAFSLVADGANSHVQ